MKKVTSIEEYNTSFGHVFLINKTTETIEVGQKISINSSVYEVKKIQLQTRPTQKEIIAIFV